VPAIDVMHSLTYSYPRGVGWAVPAVNVRRSLTYKYDPSGSEGFDPSGVQIDDHPSAHTTGGDLLREIRQLLQTRDLTDLTERFGR